MTPTASLTRAAEAVGRAFVAGDWSPAPMAARAGRALGDRRRVWLRDLALIVVHGFAHPPVDAPRELTAFILAEGSLARRWRGDTREGRAPWTVAVAMTPTAMGPMRWPVPAIDTAGDLADLLGLAPARLRWFADVASLERSVTDEPLRHYTYRWVTKRSGGARLIEAPKPMTKLFQRRVLHEILDRIPVHAAAHGFRRHRSVHTYVAGHLGQEVVVRLDLEAFFASVTAGRVYGIFRTAGYPEPVAHLLTGLVTNAVPLAVRRGAPAPPAHQRPAHRRTLHHLAHPHLPQGAPTSPALANLAAYRLDCRLTGLARAFGAIYTRYADDLAFSGPRPLARSQRQLVGLIGEIARGEGFRLNPSKTRVMPRSQRQRLGGLVINEIPNVTRADYDRLKAVLHDAARHGPAVANRSHVEQFRSHLLGRISWIEAGNPARGAKLRGQFERIRW